jgi:hypothetical protein
LCHGDHGRRRRDLDAHYKHSARYIYRGSVARVDRFETAPRGRSQHASGYAVGERLVERHAGPEETPWPLRNPLEVRFRGGRERSTSTSSPCS